MEPLSGALAWLALVLAVTAHIAFLVYLPLGGFLALRWRRTIWLHVAVVAWALGSVVVGYGCPLTDAERWARSRAGLPPLGPAGFIDHYLAGALFPAEGAGVVQAVVFAAVAVSWIAYAGSARREKWTVTTPISGPD